MKIVTYFRRKNVCLWAVLLSLSLFACDGLESTIELDLNQTEDILVIDGLITNESKTHFVRLSRNTDFYLRENFPIVTNASVLVEDSEGNQYSFLESEVVPGLYEATFTGIVGNTYRLQVNYEGRLYEAEEILEPITEIDSLAWSINERERDDPEEEDRYYEVLLYADEPQDRDDFYLFQFFRNGELLNENFTEVYFVEDAFLQERIDGIPSPFFYALGDTVTLEIYSLTRKAYVFYGDLLNALNNDGGLFSPIPANLRNNLSNGALGYFRCSAVARETIVVGE